jgi:hypothetical protein
MPRAAAALRMASQSLVHSQSALGSYCRHMQAKLGQAEGITATAHKLARIIYTMLKNHTEYQNLGAEQYKEQVRERALKNLQRKASNSALISFRLPPDHAGISSYISCLPLLRSGQGHSAFSIFSF